jgi:hypothetical protein
VPELQRAGRLPFGRVGVRRLRLLQSTIVRDGDALRKIGRAPAVRRPLAVALGLRHQGAGFTLVGRLQYRYADGTWSEWHALFDNSKSGWLSETTAGM